MQQRHILITGAGSGLGAATARVLARQGHRLALVGRRLQPLRELETSLADTGAQVRALSCDVSDAEAIRRLFDGFGDDAPDGVVCSAAELLIKPFLETTLDEYDRVMAVNVRGIWYLCQQAFRAMIKRGGGDIVLVGSLAGMRGQQIEPGKSVYAASKHAVVGLTESLAFDGRAHNIRVNCVAPGYMQTEMNERIGVSRGAGPDDVAPSIAFLLDRAQSGPTSGTTLEIFCNGS